MGSCPGSARSDARQGQLPVVQNMFCFPLICPQPAGLWFPVDLGGVAGGPMRILRHFSIVGATLLLGGWVRQVCPVDCKKHLIYMLGHALFSAAQLKRCDRRFQAQVTGDSSILGLDVYRKSIFFQL